MILVLHIVAALSSLIVTTLAYMLPSKAKLHASYALMALTLASGTFLVVSSHAHLLQACTTGLVYVGAVSVGIVGVRRKLAHAAEHNRPY
jgi:hypothetical protein